MKEWQELGKELRRFINPETFPVAIKILKDIGEIPSGTRAPLRDLKVKLAHCQAQAICRKYGWTMVMTREDLGCAISGHTYGWEPVNQEEALNFFIRMNYAADTTVALNIFQSFRTLKPGQCEAVVYSPLEWAKIEPDVILIYLNPAQLMRCVYTEALSAQVNPLPALILAGPLHVPKAFSISSLTTELGRSTTSPAAILLVRCSGNILIIPMHISGGCPALYKATPL